MTSKQNMENIISSGESDHDLISTEMLEDICDRSQTHPNVNKREAHCEIRDCVKQRQSEWKGELKNLRESWGKVYTRYLVRL